MTKLLKKSLALVLTLALCLSAMACCFIVSAEETTRTLTIELANETAPVDGDTVTLNVVGAWADVAGAEFTVNGIPAGATVETDAEEVVLNYDAAAGTVKFVDGDNAALADGTLFTISFVATVGSYELTISDTVFCDVDEADVDVAVSGINFTVAEKVTHVHDFVATVTTQPTKDAEGVMTYTCECGEGTYTEAIPMPVATTAVTFKGDIVVSSVVGNNMTISTKQMRTAYGEDATYFIVVDYKKYATGYVLEDRTMVLTAADREAVGSTANKDIVTFKDIALYEMTLDFTMTIYFVNGDGVAVGYRTLTTNIAEMALAYAPTAGSALLVALADMCKYGDEVQNYFAAKNPGTAICDAVLPSTIFADYMSNASDASGMPAAGQFNNDKGSTKVVSTTGFISAGQTLVVGASNQISYTLRYDNYDFADVKIVVSYEDSINGLMEFTLTEEELIANGTTNAGMTKYLYYFKDLALYDCDKTVTMNMYYKGTLELTSVYSIGNFVNGNLNGDLAPALTAMELFSNSAAIALNLDARW